MFGLYTLFIPSKSILNLLKLWYGVIVNMKEIILSF